MRRTVHRFFSAFIFLTLVTASDASQTTLDWWTKLDVRDLNGAAIRPTGRWIVLVFISTECPVANAELPALNTLAAEFAPRDFAFIGVYTDPTEQVTTLRRHTAEAHLVFATTDDRAQRLVRSFGATYTPEVLVYHRDGTLVYRGRIDDRVEGFGAARPAATHEDLRAVLAALSSGKTGPFPSQPGFGCSIVQPVKP